SSSSLHDNHRAARPCCPSTPKVMSKITITKLLVIILPILLLTFTTQAKPEFLALFAADPFSRPELRTKCSTCHINPQGGGKRNEFGRAFAAAGFKITP